MQMIEGMIDFLNRSYWKYAKTMPKWPHWYINRKKLESEEDHKMFCDIVLFIREHGYTERWYSKTMTYFDIGDWKLWTMGGEVIRDINEFNKYVDCKGPEFEGGYVEFILNIAHKKGLPPSVIDPNNGINHIPSLKENYGKDWLS